MSKITKVEIKSLWGRFDLEWKLNPDVNILSGINGSGKSTILECLASLLTEGLLPEHLERKIQIINVVFDDGQSIHFDSNAGYNGAKTIVEKLHNDVKIDIIKTFDNILLNTGRLNEKVVTELDKEIFRLQKQYLDYQLSIGKKAFEIVSRANDKAAFEKVAEIRQKQEKFFSIMDYLFQETGKRINRDNNEVSFLYDTEEISTWQLSSGEKQMLVILLSALVQDNNPAIIFMDEPEISLHFDWQKKLIQYVIELNPNVQIILATHSPAVVMDGWHDKVFNVRDLIVEDNVETLAEDK